MRFFMVTKPTKPNSQLKQVSQNPWSKDIENIFRFWTNEGYKMLFEFKERWKIFKVRYDVVPLRYSIGKEAIPISIGAILNIFENIG